MLADRLDGQGLELLRGRPKVPAPAGAASAGGFRLAKQPPAPDQGRQSPGSRPLRPRPPPATDARATRLRRPMVSRCPVLRHRSPLQSFTFRSENQQSMPCNKPGPAPFVAWRRLRDAPPKRDAQHSKPPAAEILRIALRSGNLRVHGNHGTGIPARPRARHRVVVGIHISRMLEAQLRAAVRGVADPVRVAQIELDEGALESGALAGAVIEVIGAPGPDVVRDRTGS